MSKLEKVSDFSKRLLPILVVLVLIPVAIHLWLGVFDMDRKGLFDADMTAWAGDRIRLESRLSTNLSGAGDFNEWYENGQKRAEGSFEEGQEEGLWTYWNEDGSPHTVKSGLYEAGGKIAPHPDDPNQ